MIDNLGDLLLKQGVELVKGDDVACGSKQCYTVTADLTPTELGPTAVGSTAGLPVDLAGATAQADRSGREGPARTTSRASTAVVTSPTAPS